MDQNTKQFLDMYFLSGKKVITLTCLTDTRQVCPRFFAYAYGTSETRGLRTCRVMVKRGVYHRWDKMQLGTTGRPNTKYRQCVAFWAEYLDDCAPRPNDETRIFPSNISLKLQYEELFIGVYVDTQGWVGAAIPSFTTWARARFDPLFGDCVSAKKHFHARCETCHTVRKNLLSAFGKEEIIGVRAFFREHNGDIKDYRQLENNLGQMAKHTPSKCQFFMYDDTECARSPHFGPNPPKSWGPRKKTLKVPLIGDTEM